MLNLQVHYINIHDQALRRTVLQRNLAEVAPPHLAVHRVEAVTREDVIAAAATGVISDSEKACYLSHCRALEQACGHDAHAYILEDDAHFGPQSFSRVTHAIDQLATRNEHWDILYTQFMPTSANHMVELLRIRNECLHKGMQIQVDTRRMLLAGASAYVVHTQAKQRLLAALASAVTLNQPVDRFYWLLAREGQLQARVVFPLPSSVAAEATTSQIQHISKAQASIIWNAFIRLSAVERDLTAIEASLRELPACLDTPATTGQVEVWLAPIVHWLDSQEIRIMRCILGYLAQPDFVQLFTVSEQL